MTTAAAPPLWFADVADGSGVVRIELTDEPNGHLGLTVSQHQADGLVTTTGIALPCEDVQHIRQVITSWLINSKDEGSTS